MENGHHGKYLTETIKAKQSTGSNLCDHILICLMLPFLVAFSILVWCCILVSKIRILSSAVLALCIWLWGWGWGIAAGIACIVVADHIARKAINGDFIIENNPDAIYEARRLPQEKNE